MSFDLNREITHQIRSTTIPYEAADPLIAEYATQIGSKYGDFRPNHFDTAPVMGLASELTVEFSSLFEGIRKGKPPLTAGELNQILLAHFRDVNSVELARRGLSNSDRAVALSAIAYLCYAREYYRGNLRASILDFMCTEYVPSSGYNDLAA